MLIYHLDHAPTVRKLPSLSVELSVVKHETEPPQVLKIVFMTASLEHKTVSNRWGTIVFNDMQNCPIVSWRKKYDPGLPWSWQASCHHYQWEDHSTLWEVWNWVCFILLFFPLEFPLPICQRSSVMFFIWIISRPWLYLSIMLNSMFNLNAHSYNFTSKLTPGITLGRHYTSGTLCCAYSSSPKAMWKSFLYVNVEFLLPSFR